MSNKRYLAFVALLLAVVTIGVYLQTLSYGFVYDDKRQVLENLWIRDLGNIASVFFSSVWSFEGLKSQNYYRPMMHLVFMAEYKLFGLSAWGWHLVNIILHTVNALLVFVISASLFSAAVKREDSTRIGSARTKGQRRGIIKGALLAALFFALHPLNSEPVSWVSAVPELTYTLFVLLSIYLYILSRRSGSIGNSAWLFSFSALAFFFGLLSKETAMALPVIVFAYNRFIRREPLFQAWRGYMVYIAIAVIYLGLRGMALGTLAIEKQSGLSSYEALVNIFPTFVRYLYRLIVPYPLKPLYVLDPSLSITSPAVLLSIIALIAAFVVIVRLRRINTLSLSAAWIAVPLVPVLYIPAVSVGGFADRYLYLSTAGFAIGLVFLVMRPGRSVSGGEVIGGHVGGGRVSGGWPPALSLVILLAALSIFTAVTVTTSRVWKDELSLYTKMVEASPGAELGHYNLAQLNASYGKVKEAEAGYLRAIEIRTDYIEAYNNLGNLYRSTGRVSEAVEILSRAVKVVPDDARTRNSLGSALNATGNLAGAVVEFRAALELEPDYAEAHNNIAGAYIRMGERDKATHHYERFLETAGPGYDEHKEKVREILEQIR